MTKTQPAGIHASTPWFINFLTSRCVQIAETIGMARMAKTINNIPTMKKDGDFADKSGIINADEKARIIISPTMTICNISNPRKNNVFFIILMVKNFSFLLSSKTWFEPIVSPGSLAVLKSRGEAAPNSRGVSRRNAFGLIQEYCTIEEIASFEGSPRFARRLIRIGFSGQKRIGDFERRKEKFLIPNFN
ncbi:hypothetical protein KKA89_00970 [Patescibacteria group bacterium]|nr:hypothetical protein [Patescibacteria group bacterium]MBU2460733.1 hypothetical protein [Patescibacteria group bacterium]